MKQLDFVREWLSQKLASPDSSTRPPRIRLLILCSIVFSVAFGVRVLHWQDNHAELLKDDKKLAVIDDQYRIEVRRMRKEGGILFPREHDPGDAQMLVHPPGYSIIIAALYGGELKGHLFERLRWLQITLDSAAAVLTLLMASELLPVAVGFIAGCLAALSPHFAYYTLFGTPDSLSVPPVLFAIYLVIKATRRPRLVTALGAGVAVGLSCWLRSNALLLAPALALLLFLLTERSKRARYALALVCATAVVIAPITIRNWVVFRTFVPLSVGSGITMVQGIANYDKEDRFGMPEDRAEVMQRDVEWHGRPDYGLKQWRPDGIMRDRYRFSRGLQAIRSDPLWFAGVMLRRAAFMLSYNSPRQKDWPENTATVPVIAPQPLFDHPQKVSDDMQPALTLPPDRMLSSGAQVSRVANVTLVQEPETAEQMFRVEGDDSQFDDQFASEPVTVDKDTDYILVVRFKAERGNMALKVTSEDRRVALGSTVISNLPVVAEKSDESDDLEDEEAAAQPPEPSANLLQVPFASGGRSQVRIVLSNDGAARPVVMTGSAQLYAIGPTPYGWTRFPRAILRATQRNLYTTSTMLPLVIAGIGLLALAKRRKALAILLFVPAYYVLFQSWLHTEYRYILAIHYFLFIFAGAALYVAGRGIKEGGRALYHRAFISGRRGVSKEVAG